MKHTPGPWEAVRNSSFWEINPSYYRWCSNVPFTIGDVCASDPGHPDGGLQEANARLIAAAPELLEALIEVEQMIQAGEMNEGTMEVVRNAIAKANGEQQWHGR